MLELITVAASNPHLIFFFCNLIIVTLILVSLEPTSDSDHKHTATPIPPPPSPPPRYAANKNKKIETTNSVSRTTPLQEIPTNVLIDVDQVSYGCNLSVVEHEELQDDELRKRVEEFIEKVNRGWKTENSSSALGSLTK